MQSGFGIAIVILLLLTGCAKNGAPKNNKKSGSALSGDEFFVRGGKTYKYPGPIPIELRPLKIYNLKNAKLILFKDPTCSASIAFDEDFIFGKGAPEFRNCFQDDRELEQISEDFINKKSGKLYMGDSLAFAARPHQAENGPFYLRNKSTDKKVEITLTSDDDTVLLCFIEPHSGESKKQAERCEKSLNRSNNYSSFYIKSPALSYLNSTLADYIEKRLALDEIMKHINASPLTFGKNAVERLSKMKDRLECDGSILKKVYVNVKAKTQPESSFSYVSAYTFCSHSKRTKAPESDTRGKEALRIKSKYKGLAR